MDSAKEKAMEAYPVISNGPFTDILLKERNAYINGYIQAEKDLALTHEDIGCIIEIWLTTIRDEKWREAEREEVSEEVLRRFNEYKQKTK